MGERDRAIEEAAKEVVDSLLIAMHPDETMDVSEKALNALDDALSLPAPAVEPIAPGSVEEVAAAMVREAINFPFPFTGEIVLDSDDIRTFARHALGMVERMRLDAMRACTDVAYEEEPGSDICKALAAAQARIRALPPPLPEPDVD